MFITTHGQDLGRGVVEVIIEESTIQDWPFTVSFKKDEKGIAYANLYLSHGEALKMLTALRRAIFDYEDIMAERIGKVRDGYQAETDGFERCQG